MTQSETDNDYNNASGDLRIRGARIAETPSFSRSSHIRLSPLDVGIAESTQPHCVGVFISEYMLTSCLFHVCMFIYNYPDACLYGES